MRNRNSWALELVSVIKPDKRGLRITLLRDDLLKNLPMKRGSSIAKREKKIVLPITLSLGRLMIRILTHAPCV